MATVIGVRFKKAGKVYYFDPSAVWPRPGESVVVETARGLELGEVVTGAREVPDDQIVSPLKLVVRLATEEDIQRSENNAVREKEAYRICQDKIISHKLEMKLVDVEYTFDNSKIIFYFTANGRVDFRELVKDLASVFKMRIELRQIGVRDEAKMLGGLGSCGRPICCGAFLGDFQPVSIKMAKEQNLSLNPTKISGQCGRLMCCLKYEQEYYETMLKKLPRVGREVMTPDGLGTISDINVIREKIRVRVHLPDGSFDMREYNLEEVQRPAPGQQSTPSPRPEEGPKPEDNKQGEPAAPDADAVPQERPPRPAGRKRGRERPEGEGRPVQPSQQRRERPGKRPSRPPRSEQPEEVLEDAKQTVRQEAGSEGQPAEAAVSRPEQLEEEVRGEAARQSVVNPAAREAEQSVRSEETVPDRAEENSSGE